MAATAPTGTFTLYRFFDAEDALLYVGLSINPGRRMEKHRDTKDWWPTVARIEMEQHPDIDALRDAERLAIETEKPKHNIRMNSGKPRRSPSLPGRQVEATDGIVGRWFHSYRPIEDDDDSEYGTLDGIGNIRQWQGQILERISVDMYLAQLYSWWDGFPTDEVVVVAQDMGAWRFFKSNQHMLTAEGCSEEFGQDRGGRCGAPCTRVIRDYEGMGPIYRCEDCIKFYSGSRHAEEI